VLGLGEPLTPDMLIEKGDSCTELRAKREEAPCEKEEETPEAEEDIGAERSDSRSALAFWEGAEGRAEVSFQRGRERPNRRRRTSAAPFVLIVSYCFRNAV
jgi:hypothetical protein